MAVSTAAAARVCATFRIRAYSRWSRVLAAALVVLASVSLPLLFLGVLFSTDPPLLPFTLMQLFLLFAVVPAAIAWLLGRAGAGTLEVYPHELVLQRGGVRVEIPVAAIACVTPWRIPLPGPGLALRLGSGRRFRYGIRLADPGALADALADVTGLDSARALRAHPVIVYAAARAAIRWRWYHLVAKFVLFALAPTAVLFNAHQQIAYGGFFGEYYQLGLGAYVRTFLIHWTTIAIYLVLYASVLRGAAEGVSLAAAAVAPSWATRVRRAAEIACRAGYYAGVPVLLLIRFLS